MRGIYKPFATYGGVCGRRLWFRARLELLVQLGGGRLSLLTGAQTVMSWWRLDAGGRLDLERAILCVIFLLNYISVRFWRSELLVLVN